MKLRFGLFLVMGAVVGVVAAACAPKNNDNNTIPTGSPTPTSTLTGTPTPAPGVTPGIKPFQSWVTPDGKELWLSFEMTGAIQSVVNIATRATTCTSLQLGLGITGTSGAFHTVRFEATPALNCANTGHTYWFDFLDGDNGCTQGCVTDQQNFVFPANSPFGGISTPVFSQIDLYDDPTSQSPAILMKAQNHSAFTETVNEARIYDTGDNFVTECDPTFTSSSSAEAALVVLCTSTPANLTPGNYVMLFRGLINGVEHFQTLPFTYHGTYPP